MTSSLCREKSKGFSSSSYTSMSPLMNVEESILNWVDLPPELTSLILHRLGAIEILKNAQKVCRSWRRVCKDPRMWRKIDLTNCRISMLNYNRLCSDAVNSSVGDLVEIKVILDYVTTSLLNYIVDRSSNLRSLGLVMYTPKESKGLPKALAKLSLLEELEISLPWWFILNLKAIFQACPQLKTLKLTLQDIYFPISDEGVTKAFAKLPLLEELWITDCLYPGKFLRAISQSCPKLKTLRLNCNPEIVYLGNNLDSNAIAVAESMPKLQHLQLLGNGITNLGLKTILDGLSSTRTP